jgi:tetratricopeptide (TPR) repeat protein
MTIAEINSELTRIKDEGNAEFKNKMFVMAGSKFSEGINIFKQNQEMCMADKDAVLKITQLYTNRALAWHNIDNQEDAFKDADFVLTHLDPNNTKALFRRAHCYKLKSQFSLAVQDLEKLCQLDTKNPIAKKDLIELKTKLKQEKSNKI